MLLKTSTRILRQCFSVYPKKMYDIWKTDPTQVHSSWNEYFKYNTQNLTSQTTSTDKNIER